MTLHCSGTKEKSTTETSETPLIKDDSSMTIAVPINKAISKHSQGLKLLMEKNSHMEISILLDLETNDVLKIYNDFLILQKMEKVAAILMNNKNNFDSFLSLERHLVKNNIDVKKIWSKVGLEQENLKLKEETKKLRFEKDAAVEIMEFWKEKFDQVNSKYQNFLKKIKRKRLLSIQHIARSLDNRF